MVLEAVKESFEVGKKRIGIQTSRSARLRNRFGTKTDFELVEGTISIAIKFGHMFQIDIRMPNPTFA